jgi:integrase
LHLSPVDALQLQRLLCGVDAAPDGRWQTARDRCAAALQLGGGLGPGDLRALRLGDVISDGGPVRGQPWQLRVAANGSAPAHVSPLAPWAGALLARWLALRETQALGGDWLFPATRSGKPWGKVAQYESARRVLADAGLDPDGGGSFRLRHSFAMRQLLHGHNADLVARWLGVVDPSVMARYQRALGQPPGSAGTPAGTPATASRMPVMPV